MASVRGLGRRMPRMVEALEAEGRTRGDIIVAPRIAASQIPDAGAVEAFAEAGADQLIVGTTSPDLATIRADLSRIADLL